MKKLEKYFMPLGMIGVVGHITYHYRKTAVG
jgi:hypothetical protein